MAASALVDGWDSEEVSIFVEDMTAFALQAHIVSRVGDMAKLYWLVYGFVKDIRKNNPSERKYSCSPYEKHFLVLHNLFSLFVFAALWFGQKEFAM